MLCTCALPYTALLIQHIFRPFVFLQRLYCLYNNCHHQLFSPYFPRVITDQIEQIVIRCRRLTCCGRFQELMSSTWSFSSLYRICNASLYLHENLSRARLQFANFSTFKAAILFNFTPTSLVFVEHCRLIKWESSMFPDLSSYFHPFHNILFPLCHLSLLTTFYYMCTLKFLCYFNNVTLFFRHGLNLLKFCPTE